MKVRDADPAEYRDRLRLIRSDNVGPVTWRKLISQYGSATKALAALPDLARKGGLRKTLKVCSIREAEQEKEVLKGLGAKLLFLGDDRYPPLLSTLEDAPPVLTVLGDPTLLHRPCVAIVGSRNASANACRFAENLSCQLGKAGFVVVSGMARGLDTTAHQGALESGTVAVLAGGADYIYPPENATLYHTLRECGTIVSEMPVGMKPMAAHFPRRNRIISGLCLGVVVVEGAIRSGSLITARLALEQGREVMAVPGSPMDPRAHGPNGLIKSGAALVESAEDVLAVQEPLMDNRISGPAPVDYDPRLVPLPSDGDLDLVRPKVIEALGPSPVPVDELIRRCQLSPVSLSTVLLELAGRLERHRGNQVCLRMA